MVQRHKEKNERAELLMGIQTAVLANHSANPPKKAYNAFHFMPSKQGEREREAVKPKKFNRQRFADEIRTVMAMLPPGRVVDSSAKSTTPLDGVGHP